MFGVIGKLLHRCCSAVATLVRPRLALRFSFFLGLAAFSLVGLFTALSVDAAQVTLAWDAMHDPNVTGYRVYYGGVSGEYEGFVDAGPQTTATLLNLEEGQAYHLVVVAYDAQGEESDPAPEIVFNGPQPDLAEGDEQGDGAAAEAMDGADGDVEPTDDLKRPDADQAPLDDAETAEALVSEHGSEPAGPDSPTNSQKIPQSQLSIVRVSSEPLRGDGAAETAIDGRVETFWHTEMGAKATRPPHELVIALNGDYVVSGFRYLPRQDGKTDGMVARYSFYVSEDGVHWGSLVATGTFSLNPAEQEVVFAGKLGSFVRFVAHTEVHGKPWTSVAEMNVLATR